MSTTPPTKTETTPTGTTIRPGYPPSPKTTPPRVILTGQSSRINQDGTGNEVQKHVSTIHASGMLPLPLGTTSTTDIGSTLAPTSLHGRRCMSVDIISDRIYENKENNFNIDDDNEEDVIEFNPLPVVLSTSAATTKTTSIVSIAPTTTTSHQTTKPPGLSIPITMPNKPQSHRYTNHSNPPISPISPTAYLPYYSQYSIGFSPGSPVTYAPTPTNGAMNFSSPTSPLNPSYFTLPVPRMDMLGMDSMAINVGMPYGDPSQNYYGGGNGNGGYGQRGGSRAKAFMAAARGYSGGGAAEYVMGARNGYGYGGEVYSNGNNGNGNGNGRKEKVPHDDKKAMWVGNLPPNVNDYQIREYFSLCDIQSIANLTRSRCAFINLTSQEEVEAAVKTYNDSIFNGCVLVCRSRKNHIDKLRAAEAAENKTSSTKATDSTPSRSSNTNSGQTSSSSEKNSSPSVEPDTSIPPKMNDVEEPQYKFDERYFILKSLTKDDLEIARERGYWATQVKNEGVLNKAFHNTRNVYLIFSANKSGEFYGYARMDSPIDPSISQNLNIEWVPVSAPSGKEEFEGTANTNYGNNYGTGETMGTDGRVYEAPKWGTPFRVKWIVIHPLPFTRVKHLRNAWNANKQIKVSRDGIEVETSIGKRLLQEWEDEVRRFKDDIDDNNEGRSGENSGGERKRMNANENGNANQYAPRIGNLNTVLKRIPPRPLQPIKTNVGYDIPVYSPAYIPTYDHPISPQLPYAQNYPIYSPQPQSSPVSPAIVPGWGYFNGGYQNKMKYPPTIPC